MVPYLTNMVGLVIDPMYLSFRSLSSDCATARYGKVQQGFSQSGRKN